MDRSDAQDAAITDLVWAAKYGDVAELRRLAGGEFGTDLLSNANPCGNTALHLAVLLGRDGFSREITTLKPDLLTVRNSSGDTPLILAVMSGNLSLATFFVDLEVLDAEQRRREMLLMSNTRGNTALHEALRGSHEELAVKLVLAEGQLARCVNSNGESPMFMAAARGLFLAVHALLRIPDSEVGGPGEKTALHAAVRMDEPGIVDMLLGKRPEMGRIRDARYGYTPLHYAAWYNNYRIVRMLLRFNEALAYVRSKDGSLPIHLAVYSDHVDIVRLLLEQICPDSALMTNQKGKNLLHAAISHKSFKVVKYIVNKPELRLLINRPDNDGNTPLHLAAKEVQPQTILALMSSSKVDKAAQNIWGDTAATSFYERVEISDTLEWHQTNYILSEGIKDSHINTMNIGTKIDNAKAVGKQTSTWMETYTNNTTVVAALMSTVTFAAAFTVPGGYDGNEGPGQGLPVLARKLAFKVFLISDAISMFTSLAVAFLCIFAPLDASDLSPYKGSTKKLLWYALVMMMIAFASGMYTVLESGNLWLAVLLCAMCGILPFCTYVIGRWPEWKLRLIVGRLTAWKLQRKSSKAFKPDKAV